MEAKDAEISYAIDGLSSSHPNKRGKFSFQSFKIDIWKITFAIITKREEVNLTFLNPMVIIKIKVHIFKKDANEYVPIWIYLSSVMFTGVDNKVLCSRIK